MEWVPTCGITDRPVTSHRIFICLTLISSFRFPPFHRAVALASVMAHALFSARTTHRSLSFSSEERWHAPCSSFPSLSPTTASALVTSSWPFIQSRAKKKNNTLFFLEFCLVHRSLACACTISPTPSIPPSLHLWSIPPQIDERRARTRFVEKSSRRKLKEGEKKPVH